MESGMRFLYALIAMSMWMIFMNQMQGVSADTKFLALALIFAGALAGGGDRK